jgi:hypothetical protein
MLRPWIAGKHPATEQERTQMAHAQLAERPFPQAAIISTIAFVAAAVLAGAIALVAFDPLGLQAPPAERRAYSPALVEAGRLWELQRKAELGDVDPLVDYGRDWERQRRQQGA